MAVPAGERSFRFFVALIRQKRTSKEAQSDARVINAVVFDVCGNQIGSGFEFGTGVAHGDFGPVVDKHGHIVDSVGHDDGQFSPERSGSIPMLEMLELCYSGEHTKMQMHKMIRGQGGMFAHLGTSNCQEIEKRIEDGDELAKKVFEAQAYQIAKTIGLLSIVLKGDCDAIILTGGLAHSKALTKLISEYVEFIAPVIIMPGENEMQALAQGGLRLLDSKEQIHEYFYPKEDI